MFVWFADKTLTKSNNYASLKQKNRKVSFLNLRRASCTEPQLLYFMVTDSTFPQDWIKCIDWLRIKTRMFPINISVQYLYQFSIDEPTNHQKLCVLGSLIFIILSIYGSEVKIQVSAGPCWLEAFGVNHFLPVQIVGRTQFLAVMGLKSPESCCLSLKAVSTLSPPTLLD